jgi:hypothetical protein
VTWCWLALVDDDAGNAAASAVATRDDGSRAGLLAIWRPGRKPVPQAVRADARVLDPAGGPAHVSLVILERGREPLFDDPAVSGALRRVLAGPAPDVVTTLVRDASHFAGALTVRRDRLSLLQDDPFARLGRPERLSVAAGLLGRRAAAPGPVIQRYSGQPWPAAGFET